MAKIHLAYEDIAATSGLTASATSKTLVINHDNDTLVLDGTTHKLKVGAITQSQVTGLTTTLGNMDSATAAKLPLAGGTMTGAIVLAADPLSSMQAVTKQYVDGLFEGKNAKNAAVVATTVADGNIDFADVPATIDGHTLVSGERVIVKNNTLPAENGVYVVTVGTPSTAVRAVDLDSAAELTKGAYVFVLTGTVNARTGWIVTDVVTTIGTDPVNWVQISGSDNYTAGTGLTKTGTAFSITDISGITTGTTFNNFQVNARGQVTATSNASYQAADADLTAIAALTGVSGFLKTDGAGVWSVDTSSYQVTNATLTSVISAGAGATTGILVKTAENTWSLVSASTTYQPLDADLTAIAALAGTSGLLRKTAADTWTLDTTLDTTLAAKADKVGSVDIEITDATKGIILVDSNAVRYRITVDTTGNLVSTAL